MKRFCTILAMALLLACTARAASINIIQLQNRPAEEIIPIVEPMLGPGEVITGQGFKLFLRSSAETLEQVQEMIGALDIAAKMLQISVFQGSKRSLEEINVGGNLQIETGSGSIGVGSNDSAGAGSINYGSGNVSGDINASSIRQRREDNPVHRLRVAEGTEGFIETGSQVPFLSGRYSSDYKAVTTGFYVLPRLRGDSVTLQVSPFKNALSQSGKGNIDTQSATTTISGRLGEWLQIGGVTESSSSSQRGIASYSSSKSETSDRIWIKAELVR